MWGAAGILAITMQAGPAAAPIAFRETVEVDAAELKLGDIADVSKLPSYLRIKAAKLRLYAMPKGVHRFDHVQLASRARSLMPTLGPWLSEAQGELVAYRGARQVALQAQCGSDGLDRGARANVSIDAGPFRIEREVWLLQRAEPGRRFFAKTSDGDVIAAVCAEEI